VGIGPEGWRDMKRWGSRELFGAIVILGTLALGIYDPARFLRWFWYGVAALLVILVLPLVLAIPERWLAAKFAARRKKK